MSEALVQEKRRIRREMEAMRQRLTPAEIEAASQRILHHLSQLEAFRRAEVVHCYVAWRNEVRTHELIRQLLAEGRRVVVPVVDRERQALQHAEITRFDELQPGAFGILEPPPERRRLVQPEDLDVVLVPGVAFDRFGNRLGYGGGYYDGFLKGLDAVKIGLAYAFQLVDRLPTNARDQRVDYVVTEAGVFKPGNEARPQPS